MLIFTGAVQHMSLKDRALHGFFWSFIDSLGGQGIQFIVSIVLARMLTPREFGLIGMITIFIAISQTFIDSGFRNALIRKQKCTDDDYSTVFYFNLLISVLVYLILFFSSDIIAEFFNEPRLSKLLKILGIGLIFNAFGIIQSTIFTKNIDFKKQTRISISCSLIAGIIAIAVAKVGFGVWSLVILTLVKYGLSSVFLWLWTIWRPKLIFNLRSFTELFSFGSNLLLSGLLNTIYENVYYFIVGKYFSAVHLGYYTRADQFKMLPSQTLTGIITRVSYPVLSSIQNDKYALKHGYKRIIRTTTFVSFILMIGMAAVAKPMIIVLIGVKWLIAAEYLQILCFVGMFYPLHALNLSMLQVVGRSDLFLRLEIIKKILAMPTIIIGIIFGIKPMIFGMIGNTLLAFYLNSYWSGKFISYSFSEQVKDILPSFMLACIMGLTVFFAGQILHLHIYINLVIQIVLGAMVTWGICELFRFSDYLYFKARIIDHFYRR